MYVCMYVSLAFSYKLKQITTGIHYRLGLFISKFSKRTQELQWAVPNHAFFSYLKVRTYLVARRTPPGD